MMRVIGEAMLKVRRQVIRDETEILYAIEHGTAAKVSSLISVDPWLEIQETIQEELFVELVSGGQRVKLPTIRKEVLSYRFDATRPEAANWASKEAGTLIREIGEEQTNLVREYVSQASMGEFTPRQVARNLRDVIGLTSAQAGWVENFRNRQISEQMLRGKSYDQAYVASEKATERYHARIHRYRTETIARTEILRASHEGRREAWQQGIEEGFINAGASKQWSTELDGRECEICGPLDGETVLITAEFSDGEPPIHPNCRCDVLLVDDVDADLEGLTSEELDAIIDDLISPQETEGLTRDEFVAGLSSDERDEYETALLLGRSDEEARLYAVRDIADELIPVNKMTPEEFDNKLGQMYQDRNSYVGSGDPTGYAVQKATGYDAKPIVGNKSQIDSLIDKGWIQSYRGVMGVGNVTANEIYRGFRQGELYPGRGIFGNGTYSAVDKLVSQRDYAGGVANINNGTGAVWRMAISPDARIIKYSELDKMTPTPSRPDITGPESMVEQGVYYDRGYRAIREGYDIIHVEASDNNNSDYYVILNRGVVAVQNTLEG
jgi:hypothetical protein